MSDSENVRNNRFDLQQQQAARKGFGSDARSAARQHLGLTGQCLVCKKNPASPAFTSKLGGRTYEFCSKDCKTVFDSAPDQYT